MIDKHETSNKLENLYEISINNETKIDSAHKKSTQTEKQYNGVARKIIYVEERFDIMTYEQNKNFIEPQT